MSRSVFYNTYESLDKFVSEVKGGIIPDTDLCNLYVYDNNQLFENLQAHIKTVVDDGFRCDRLIVQIQHRQSAVELEINKKAIEAWKFRLYTKLSEGSEYQRREGIYSYHWKTLEIRCDHLKRRVHTASRPFDTLR